jgi:hypothetical protein
MRVHSGKNPAAQRGCALAQTELPNEGLHRPANAVIQLWTKKEERIVLAAKSFD